MNTYLFIQGFLLGMAVMLAICIVPSVIADIKKEKDDESKERVYCKDCRYCDVIIEDERSESKAMNILDLIDKGYENLTEEEKEFIRKNS